MFPFKKKKEEPTFVEQKKVDHKQTVRDVITAAKSKLATIEALFEKEDTNRIALQQKDTKLTARAGELNTAIAHGAKIIALDPNNSIMSNHVEVAKRELLENESESKLVKIDLTRVLEFLSSTGLKVDELKKRIDGLESELADLSLRDLEVSITSELSDTSKSIRDYRQEVFTKEAAASFND